MQSTEKSQTSKAQTKNSSKKGWLVLLVIVLVIAIALAVYFFVNKEENRDYHNPETYIGLSEVEAMQKAEDVGYEVRVIEREGQRLGADADLREDRINFSISDGKVEEAELY